jgi:hypothetical protein
MFSGQIDIQDGGNADPIAMLLQAGYLTVRTKHISDDISRIILTIPNHEFSLTIMNNYVDSRVIPVVSQINDDF